MAGTPPPHPTSPLPRLPLQALARASSVWIPSPPQQLDPARVYHAGPSQPKRGGNGRPETCKPAVDRPRAGTQSRPPPSDTLNGSVFQGPPPPPGGAACARTSASTHYLSCPPFSQRHASVAGAFAVSPARPALPSGSSSRAWPPVAAAAAAAAAPPLQPPPPQLRPRPLRPMRRRRGAAAVRNRGTWWRSAGRRAGAAAYTRVRTVGFRSTLWGRTFSSPMDTHVRRGKGRSLCFEGVRGGVGVCVRGARPSGTPHPPLPHTTAAGRLAAERAGGGV